MRRSGSAAPSRTVKRSLDILLSLIGIAATLPLLLLVAVAIRLESRGPVLFRQERVGRDGARFRVLKLRTMREDAEARLQEDPDLRATYRENGYKLASGEDPRVTPLGKWLRRTSVDELPQLLNVLRGEMSLVGPRPVVPEEVAEYGGDAGLVLSVRPGMTGLWQVSGRNAVDYPRRARLDAGYVREWSLLLDLRVLLRTPAAVARGEVGRASAAGGRPPSLPTGPPATVRASS